LYFRSKTNLVKNFLYKNIYKYIKTYINIYNYIQNAYTGCPILNNALRFFENYGRYGKMFHTKIWFGGGHKKVLLI